MLKMCSKCKKTKKLEEFYKDARYKYIERSWCKSCCLKYSKKYYLESNEGYKNYNRSKGNEWADFQWKSLKNI